MPPVVAGIVYAHHMMRQQAGCVDQVITALVEQWNPFHVMEGCTASSQDKRHLQLYVSLVITVTIAAVSQISIFVQPVITVALVLLSPSLVLPAHSPSALVMTSWLTASTVLVVSTVKVSHMLHRQIYRHLHIQ